MASRVALESSSPIRYSSNATGAVPPQPYLPLPANRQRVIVTAPSAASLIGSCHGLILDMVNRGHRVFTFAPELSNKDLRVLSHIGAEAYALPGQIDLLEKYSRIREMARIFRDVDPHIVIVQSAKNGASTAAAAKMAKAPYVVTVVPSLGPAFMEGARTAAWAERQAMKAVYRTLFRWSDAVLFHSAHDQKYAREFKLVSPSKPQLAVGGWGEDLTRNAQRTLPPLDRGMLFLMAAPLDRFQGIEEYCEAAKAMRLKARRARFFLASVAGDVAMPFPIEELKRYREFVQYIGPVEDASTVIARSHVVVAPCHGNGAPRAVFQALALGRPLIASDTRSCRDFVQHGLNGFRVPVRDSVALARGMTMLLQRPDAIPAMAEESRRQALKFYDVNSVNAIVLGALGL